MRVNRRALALLAGAAALASPAGALAAKTKVYDPPGKAGASEYAEVVPSSGGNVAPPYMGGGNPTAAQISKLGAGRSGVRKLAKLGTQGAAAAHFAAQTAPVRSTAPALPATGGLASGGSGGPARATQLRAQRGSAINGLAGLLGGSDAGGIGVLLPLLLALGLGGAIAFSAARVLRARRPPA